MTEVNVPLLRKAVEWAEAEDAKPFEVREWMQDAYVVPASTDDERMNGMFDFNPSFLETWINQKRDGKSEDCGTCYCIAGFVDAQAGRYSPYMNIMASAAELLGIDSEQACDLFYSSNTIEDVRRIAEEIAGERL